MDSPPNDGDAKKRAAEAMLAKLERAAALRQDVIAQRVETSSAASQHAQEVARKAADAAEQQAEKLRSELRAKTRVADERRSAGLAQVRDRAAALATLRSSRNGVSSERSPEQSTTTHRPVLEAPPSPVTAPVEPPPGEKGDTQAAVAAAATSAAMRVPIQAFEEAILAVRRSVSAGSSSEPAAEDTTTADLALDQAAVAGEPIAASLFIELQRPLKQPPRSLIERLQARTPPRASYRRNSTKRSACAAGGQQQQSLPVTSTTSARRAPGGTVAVHNDSVPILTGSPMILAAASDALDEGEHGPSTWLSSAPLSASEARRSPGRTRSLEPSQSSQTEADAEQLLTAVEKAPPATPPKQQQLQRKRHSPLRLGASPPLVAASAVPTAVHKATGESFPAAPGYGSSNEFEDEDEEERGATSSDEDELEDSQGFFEVSGEGFGSSSGGGGGDGLLAQTSSGPVPAWWIASENTRKKRREGAAGAAAATAPLGSDAGGSPSTTASEGVAAEAMKHLRVRGRVASFHTPIATPTRSPVPSSPTRFTAPESPLRLGGRGGGAVGVGASERASKTEGGGAPDSGHARSSRSVSASPVTVETSDGALVVVGTAVPVHEGDASIGARTTATTTSAAQEGLAEERDGVVAAAAAAAVASALPPPPPPVDAGELAARLEAAAAARERLLEERAASLRSATAARVSRTTLAEETRRRERIAARLTQARSVLAAAARRAESVEQRVDVARGQTNKARRVAGRVRAARRLQSWFRFRRILSMNEKVTNAEEAAAAVSSSATAAAAAVANVPGRVIEATEAATEAEIGTAGLPAAAAALAPAATSTSSLASAAVPPPTPTPTEALSVPRPALHVPSSLISSSSRTEATTTTTTTHEDRGGSGGSGARAGVVALPQQVRAARRALATFDTAAAQRALRAVAATLQGHPELDPGAAAAGGSTAGAEGTAVSTPAPVASHRHPESAAAAGGAIDDSPPFPDFDTAAFAIQQRGVLAAAQAVTQAMMKAYGILEEADVIPPSSSSDNAMTTMDNAAHLRPSLWRSPRTLLAALLIAYFPDEILTSEVEDDHAHSAATGAAAATMPQSLSSVASTSAAATATQQPSETITTGAAAGAAAVTESRPAHTSHSSSSITSATRGKRDRDMALRTSSRRMLSWLHAVCRVMAVEAPPQPAAAAAVPATVGAVSENARTLPSGAVPPTDDTASLAAMRSRTGESLSSRVKHRGYSLSDVVLDFNIDTSPFVEPELRVALMNYATKSAESAAADTGAAAPATLPSSSGVVAPALAPVSATTRSSVSHSSPLEERLHVLLAFNAAWCTYMDAFGVWKSGDGVRFAQALARTYRALVARSAQLAYEASSAIGIADAGLAELRAGVEEHLTMLRSQLVTLLGASAAAQWEKDQRTSMAAEAARAAMIAAAGSPGMQGGSPGVTTSATQPSGGGVPSSLTTGASGGVSGRRGSGTGGAPSSPLLRGTTPTTAPVAPSPLRRGSTGGAATSSTGSGRDNSAAGGSAATARTTTDSESTAANSSTLPPPATMLGGVPSMALYKNVMSNEALAHELIIDPVGFRLPAPVMPEDIGFEGEEEQEGEHKLKLGGGSDETITTALPSFSLDAAAASDVTAAAQMAAPPRGGSSGASESAPSSAASSASSRSAMIRVRPSNAAGAAAGAAAATSSPAAVESHSVAAPVVPTASSASAASTTAASSSSVSRPPHAEALAPSVSSMIVPSSPPPEAARRLAAKIISNATGSGGGGGSAATPGAEEAAASATSTPSSSSSTRTRYRGKLQLGADPSLLRMNPAFWDAALRAAVAATASSSAFASSSSSPGRGGSTPSRAPLSPNAPGSSTPSSLSAAAAAGGPGGDGVDLPPSGDASVDMVLSALISIRDAISSLVPHRADWAAELAAHIDPSLLRGMMLARAFGPPDWLALMRYVGGKLQALEAPVRGEETRAWLEAAQAHVKRLSARQQQRQQEAQPQQQGRGRASPSPSSPRPPLLDDDVLSLLPRFLAWVHFKVAQTRVDVGNAQLAGLAPYLAAGGRGAEYERARFTSALERGDARLSGTQAWVSATVTSMLDRAVSSPSACAAAVAAGAKFVAHLGPTLAPADAVAALNRLQQSSSAAATATAPASSTIPDSVASSSLLQSSVPAVTYSDAHRTGDARALLRSLLLRDWEISRLCMLRDGLLRLVELDQPCSAIAASAAQAPDGCARVVNASSGTGADAASAPSSSVSTSPGSASAAASAASSMLRIPYPETLQLDARRLTDAQNVLQRAALVSTLVAIVRQVVATSPSATTAAGAGAAGAGAAGAGAAAPGGNGGGVSAVPPSPPSLSNRPAAPTAAASHSGSGGGGSSGVGSLRIRSLADVERHAAAWLLDDTLRLPDLVSGCISAADELCAREGKRRLLQPPQHAATVSATPSSLSSLEGQHQEDTAATAAAAEKTRNTLAAAVGKAVSSRHPLFRSFARRIEEELRGALTAELWKGLPPGPDARLAPLFPFFTLPAGVVGVADASPSPAAAAAAPSVIPAACSEEVRSLVQGLARIVKHNHAVHASHYRALMQALL